MSCTRDVPPAQEQDAKRGEAEEDEDEWEDASDGEDAGSDDGGSEEGEDQEEKRDAGKEETAAAAAAAAASSPLRPAPASVVVTSPKEQRTPRPKVQIPSPAAAAAAVAQDSPDGAKPLSPFAPPDGYQPVTDWGDAMEEQSPCSSVGGESPLKPPSADGSPAQAQAQTQSRRPQEGAPRRGRHPPTNLQEELDSAAGRSGS